MVTWTFKPPASFGEPMTAEEIIAAEKAERDAKTARLREARLAKEAAAKAAHAQDFKPQ